MTRVTFETIREIALRLPGVEDGLSYGTPALKVRKKLMVRLRDDLSAIVIRTTFEEREELMAAQSEVYFITPHYEEYPWVLVNLDTVPAEALPDLLGRAHALAR